MRIYTATLILLISLSHTNAKASLWDCFKLFQKVPSEKLVHGLSQKNTKLIEKIDIGDQITLELKNSQHSGFIKNFNFKNIVIETFEGKTINTSFSKVSDIKIFQSNTKSSNNRFKILINNKKLEANYFKGNENLHKEFEQLTLLNSEQQVSINKLLATKIENLIKDRFQTNDIGFHFNLNGGQAIDYINAGGVRASRGGDVAIQYGARNAQIAPQSYFFRTNDEMSLYDIISMGNMKRIRQKSGRMGNVVNIFKADDQFFRPGLSSGLIEDTGISYIFSEKWLSQNSKNEIGIPYSTYLTEPLEIYEYKKFGFKKLNRNQVDFLALKQIEFNILK